MQKYWKDARASSFCDAIPTKVTEGFILDGDYISLYLKEEGNKARWPTQVHFIERKGSWCSLEQTVVKLYSWDKEEWFIIHTINSLG